MARWHDRRGTRSLLGWMLIGIGALALAPSVGGLVFGGLVGIVSIVAVIFAVVLAAGVTVAVLGLTSMALAAPFVALLAVPFMALRALLTRCCFPALGRSWDNDYAERRPAQIGRRRPTPLGRSTGVGVEADSWAYPPSQRDTATVLLRERYAAGEVSQAQFQEHLINLLKERYVSGEIDQNQYERQLEVLLRPPSPGRGVG